MLAGSSLNALLASICVDRHRNVVTGKNPIKASFERGSNIN